MWPDIENKGDCCEKQNEIWGPSDTCADEIEEKECGTDAECPSKYMLKNKWH